MTTNYAPRDAAHPFVVVSSDIIKNPRLTSVESRIMSILLSLPQGWQPNAKHLSNLMSEGTAAIQRAISRLKQLGYLVCRSVRDAMGRFLRSDWEINEIPAPPTDKNIDVRGNVVEFDRPQKAPKNLRTEARSRAKNEAKSNSAAHPKTVTTATFDPYLENPDTGFGDRSNIDIRSIQSKDLEREARACIQDLEKENPSEAEERVLGNTQAPTIEQQRFCETPRDSRSDESSATAESGKSWDKTELKQFQDLLTEYGRRSGRKSPPGWAYTIVKNLKLGIPCTYWEEFKNGVPIGTCDRREWETAPGVPCTAAKQCLEERFLSKPGATPIEAALQVPRVLANPQQMAIVWESIKARVIFLREEWRRHASNGVQHAVVDSWMRPREVVLDEDAVAALSELQQNLPQQLQASETVFAIEGEIACAIEPEIKNLGPEIDIEEQNRNIARLAQLLRSKRGGGANIAPVEPLKGVGERSIDAQEPLSDDDLW